MEFDADISGIKNLRRCLQGTRQLSGLISKGRSPLRTSIPVVDRPFWIAPLQPARLDILEPLDAITELSKRRTSDFDCYSWFIYASFSPSPYPHRHYPHQIFKLCLRFPPQFRLTLLGSPITNPLQQDDSPRVNLYVLVPVQPT